MHHVCSWRRQHYSYLNQLIPQGFSHAYWMKKSLRQPFHSPALIKKSNYNKIKKKNTKAFNSWMYEKKRVKWRGAGCSFSSLCSLPPWYSRIRIQSGCCECVSPSRLSGHVCALLSLALLRKGVDRSKRRSTFGRHPHSIKWKYPLHLSLDSKQHVLYLLWPINLQTIWISIHSPEHPFTPGGVDRSHINLSQSGTSVKWLHL